MLNRGGCNRTTAPLNTSAVEQFNESFGSAERFNEPAERFNREPMSAGPIRLPAALLSTEWLSGFTAEFRGRLPVPKVINLVPKLGPNFIGISGQAGSCGRSTSGRHTVGTSPVFPDRDAESAESQVVYPFQQWKALTIPASETVPPEGVKDPTTADTRKSYFVETLLHESHLRYWLLSQVNGRGGLA